MAYTTIDDPSAYFQIKLWTGTGSSQTVNFDGNSDLQADWIWHKEQDDTNGWHQTDTSIGIANYLATQDGAAEYGVGSAYVSGIGSNSISYGGGDSSFNSNSVEQATWAWKANGGSTSSNTDGDLTSTVQVNSTAGFSIITYTGKNPIEPLDIGHGLGEVPDVFIIKNRDRTANWGVYHKDLTAPAANRNLKLNLTNAEAAESSFWRNEAPTSTVIKTGEQASVNVANEDFVAYAFAERQGYSKFGKYVGNASADGTFVYTGFQPAFVMIKTISTTDDWYVFDNKRAGYNPAVFRLRPNTTGSQTTGTNNTVDHLSNGFKLRFTGGSINGSGLSYIYMAFAEHPFVTSTGVPTTAR